MVYSDRNLNQEAIANLNSTSPLIFSETLSAEELARDLDLFANTQFFDFDFGGSASAFTSSLDSRQQPNERGDRNVSDPLDSISNFNFLSEPLSFDLSSPVVMNNQDTPSKRPKVEESSLSARAGDTPAPLDDAARAAAEEDKRRRNTLASARFRAKKKMREQALEKDHKEMSAKIEKMESRIKELELENKWLRGLVVQNKPT